MSYFDKKNFKDKEIYNISKQHMNYIISHAFYRKTYKSINASRINVSRIITALFGDVLLNNIDKNFILALYKNTNFTTGNTLILNRFLLFLIDGNFINNISEFKYIMAYRERLERYGNPMDVIRILTSNYMEDFLQNGLLDTKKSRYLCLINIDKNDFIDDRLYSLLSSHIDMLKLNSNSTIDSKENICFYAKNILTQVFSNIYLEDITQEFIYNKLSSLDASLKSSYFLEITKGLLYLIDNGVITDDNVNYFKELGQHFLNGTNRKKLESVFATDIIQKYKIVPIGNSNYKNQLVYFDIMNETIRNIFVDFTSQYNHRDTPFITVCKEFDKSLNGYLVKNILDLNFDTYKTQIRYFSKYKSIVYSSPITAFYLYIHQNYNQELFKQNNIDSRLLQRPLITSDLLKGFEIILYNPLEAVPECNKWLFCYKGMEDTNTTITTTSSLKLNFTKIKCSKYRNWVKHYVWNNTSSIYTKTHSLSKLICFFNYIYDLKLGNELSIYAKKTSNLVISINEIISYKNYILNKYNNNRTRISYIYCARNILNHVVDYELDRVEKGLLYHLSFTLDNRYDNTDAISDEHLKKLASLMKAKAKEHVEYALYYSIFYIALETEFRSSQILVLTIDCVHETSKPNEYVIKSKTKVSANTVVKQAITVYVKKHIDEIIKITNDYRINCANDELKQYIFLLPSNKKGTYKILKAENFNSYFKNCCKKLGIKEYTLSNLRDTHMTKAEEFIIRNSLSEMEQNILSGHKSSNIDTKHYIDTQIKELLEAVHGIFIGNITLDGKIVKEVSKDIATKENSVSNECGYCVSSSCNNFSYLDCMMCNDFITTIDRIPYFKDQIKIIDKKIENASIKHDKEDYVNIKLLLVNYLKELLKIKGEDFIE
ncbi:hypothetical protein [Vallitalea maricola]|uniref:Uncharacterized protein n=1 Tax=Vallitalea maricola TaxID=3074433 RepID=A0ACB5UQ87_9FIRM|nr:hypothetical protein AN2V17_43840 [Vallitalea sp. AN17-2]